MKERITAEEFKEKYFDDTDYWRTSGQYTHMSLEKHELMEAKLRTVKKSVKKKADEGDNLESLSLSQLNKVTLDIMGKYMKDYPNTYQALFPKDKEYKRVIKQIKELKKKR